MIEISHQNFTGLREATAVKHSCGGLTPSECSYRTQVEPPSKLTSKTTYCRAVLAVLPQVPWDDCEAQPPSPFKLAQSQNLPPTFVSHTTPAYLATHHLPTSRQLPLSFCIAALSCLLLPIFTLKKQSRWFCDHPHFVIPPRWLLPLHPTPRFGSRPSCLRLLRTLALHEPTGTMYEIGTA